MRGEVFSLAGLSSRFQPNGMVEQPDLPVPACPTVCSPVKSKVIQALGDHNKLNGTIAV